MLRWQRLTAAAIMLAVTGCGTEPTAQLVEKLKAPAALDRLKAARTLPQRQADAAQAVPALTEALRDPSADVRKSAAFGLGSFGAQARDAIPALKTAQRDRESDVRKAAGIALAHIDPKLAPPSRAELSSANRRRRWRFVWRPVSYIRQDRHRERTAIAPMPRPGRKVFWKSFRRRLSAGLTLLAYLMTAFGVPLPAGARPVTGAASACQGEACGCANSDECRTSGCGCSAPVAVPTPPCCSTAPTDVPCTGGSDCPMPCCQHGKPKPPCAPTPPSPAPVKPSVPSDDESKSSGVRWVVGIAAMKCRGHSTVWVTAGVILPAPTVVVWQPQLDRFGWLTTSADRAPSQSVIPPDPPPRSTV